MTYEQALEFWFGRINYEKRSPRLADLKLDRMQALLDLLGRPHVGMPVIHIAGSKGKGSTAAMLAEVLHKAGYRTGLFTSPHLHQVEERIQVEGCPISQEDLTTHMERIQSAVLSLDAHHPKFAGATFFEIITALGFLHFVHKNVDVAVLEVGLGGRFDATNVCQPILTLITSIGFDHVQQLGNTLAKIAFEKAGITKPGCPALSGACLPEPREVIEQICRERKAPLRQLRSDFDYTYEPGQISGQNETLPCVQIRTERQIWPAMILKLFGEHQATNAALVVAAVEELRQQGWVISDNHVAQGLAQVHWPARFEVLNRQPLVIIDCAHNVASAQAFLDTLQTTVIPSAKRYLLFASSHDKDVPGMLRLLLPHFDHVFLTRYHNNPRFVPPEQLARIVEKTGSASFTVRASSQDTWQQVQALAGPDDLICITGSVFLAGEIRPYLMQEE